MLTHPTSTQPIPTLLEAGLLPVEELAQLAAREARDHRPIYDAHRWFARRFGSAFRALLVAASLPASDPQQFWAGYYGKASWQGQTVLDPFMGGGTSLIEALRLGANVIGVDVDAVACAISSFEARAVKVPDLAPTLARLKEQAGSRLAPFYKTMGTEGQPLEVLHYFWVQQVDCRGCGQMVEVHPHYQLAYDAEGTQQWAFCQHCHAVQQLDRSVVELHCAECGDTTIIQCGVVKYGKLTCPHCQTQERLIDVAAHTGKPPQFRLFALEVLTATQVGRSLPMSQRRFQRATEFDQQQFAAAQVELMRSVLPDSSVPNIPDRRIPTEGRSDDRIIKYGYQRYSDLFNARQLLHLSTLAEAIKKLDEPEREACAIAFSHHLLTNCMLTHYAFGWRRLAPLFSVRAYRHVPRPVEINPWLVGTGRGTFPNAVRQVQRAVEYARLPREALRGGGFQTMPDEAKAMANAQVRVLNQNAARLDGVADSSVDLALTDPPYFDNIAYSELSDFFLPWMQMLGLVAADEQDSLGWRENLAPKRRDSSAAASFQQSLGNCFAEVARVLKPDGRLTFTFQHRTAEAWLALAGALASAKLQVVQVFPMLGDANDSLHTYEGTSKWDAVFVAKKAEAANTAELSLTDDSLAAAKHHHANWVQRLTNAPGISFRLADSQNLYRACLVAVALGMSGMNTDTDSDLTLAEALREPSPEMTSESVAHP